MRWMAKHASSLQLTSAKTGSTPSLAPTMADVSSMTQRYPVKLIYLLNHYLIMSLRSHFVMTVSIQVYFPVGTFISV